MNVNRAEVRLAVVWSGPSLCYRETNVEEQVFVSLFVCSSINGIVNVISSEARHPLLPSPLEPPIELRKLPVPLAYSDYQSSSIIPHERRRNV